MTEYLHKDVFLDTATARTLYHETAAELPIIDFHTHLPEGEILDDHRFANLWELWLKHDHYKWRLMRACGIDEARITGEASPWEKFEAFASIMPLAPGNPVHHWAHFELKRVFNIHLTLSKDTAEEIWNTANQQLQNDSKLSVRGLLEKFNVVRVCTTDDPTASLAQHKSLAEEYNTVSVLPTFRPDTAHNVQVPAEYNEWLQKLGELTGKSIDSFKDLVDALQGRHKHFQAHGCKLSDHGLSYAPQRDASEAELESIFSNALNGQAASDDEWEAFAYAILKHVAEWNHQAGWTMQLHLGPQRNVNSSTSRITGRDSGFDTMGSKPQTEKLISFLDALNSAGILGKTIVYNLNPVESEPICCALQNFQNEKAQGLLQYGPAWWHLDHIRGIREQFDILSSLGAIGTSIGMLTDSRSFTSYVRHEYYRRLLCQYIGKAAEAGEIPNDPATLKTLVTDICYNNPQNYFSW